MKIPRSLLVLACLPAAHAATDSAPADASLETVLISGQRAERASRGATGLDLDIKDTPQSISVVTAEQMTEFGADNINDALRLATGINVEEWETNRTNYMSRGFEIKNTQLDGVGLPNNWGIVTGAIDAYGYEKLEVIRGANGLLTGVGNASGTINFVRKRPTNDARGEVRLTGRSWSGKRVEADYSTPFTASGAWAGRVVVAAEDGDSYLRGLANQRVFAYGVIDGQIGERATVALGYSFQDARTDGNLWGALVFSNSDGTQASFARSASTSQDWTYWNTRNHGAFAELTVALAERWTLKGTYNFRRASEADKLFFAYSTTGLDPVTHLGLVGWPGRYVGSDRAHLGELSLSGRFDAFGREHELIVGASQGSSSAELDNFPVSPTDPAFGALPAFPYAGSAVPEPVWGARQDYDDSTQRLRRGYLATRLSLSDRWKAVVGANFAAYRRAGTDSFGVGFEQSESELSPYAGLTVDLTPALLAYASYSDIYQPQDQKDLNQRYLAPSKGVNYELGLKGQWLDDRLLTTAALFRAEQRGLSTFAGIDANANYYYEGVDVDSEGIELEASGRLGEHARIVLGVTALRLEGPDGGDLYEWVPRRTVNLSLSSRLPRFPALSFGVNGRWQSDISKIDEYTNVRIRQNGYATLNLSGDWAVTPNAHVRANVFNVTDEKYIGSLYQVGFYGAPRNYALSVDYRF